MTAGGRVLGVTGVGPTLIEARHRAYTGVGSISWPGAHYRTDIALAARAGDAGETSDANDASEASDGGRSMIPRYSPPAMAALFTDEARFAGWLEVELLATEAWADIGVVPRAAADVCRSRAPKVDVAFVEAVAERERVTDHDVAAFVDVVQAAIGQPEGSWIHYGLTSSDVVDTALCATLTRAADQLLVGLEAAGGRRAKSGPPRPSTFPSWGRTHGQHAEPTTYGTKFALWALQADRDRQRLEAARGGGGREAVGSRGDLFEHRPPGRGPCLPRRSASSRCRPPRWSPETGTPSTSGPALRSAPPSRPSPPRSATWPVPRWARSRSRSSPARRGARPCPTSATRSWPSAWCGLARVLRGYLVSGLEDVALWHERDISHSSVERVVLPDASMLALYVLGRPPISSKVSCSIPSGPKRRSPRAASASSSASRCSSPWWRAGCLGTALTASSSATPDGLGGAEAVPVGAGGRQRGHAVVLRARRSLRPRRVRCATSTGSPTPSRSSHHDSHPPRTVDSRTDRQGPRALRRRRRSPVDGRLRSHLRLRCDHGRAHPRQRSGAHGHDRLLAGGALRPRPQPPPHRRCE